MQLFPYGVIIGMEPPKQKTKKPYVKKQKNSDVSKLASDILNDAATEAVAPAMNDTDVPEVPEVIPERNDGDIPGKREKIAFETPKRIIFDQGTDRLSAFVIRKHIDETYHILGKLFGYNNGDYFVINEITSTTVKNGQRRRHRCILLEDKNNFRYNIWFDLTNLGPVY